jgi:hypothetical protein
MTNGPQMPPQTGGISSAGIVVDHYLSLGSDAPQPNTPQKFIFGKQGMPA